MAGRIEIQGSVDQSVPVLMEYLLTTGNEWLLAGHVLVIVRKRVQLSLAEQKICRGVSDRDIVTLSRHWY